MDVITGSVIADIARQFPFVIVLLFIHLQSLKAFKTEQQANREQHDRHITALVGRLVRIEDRLGIPRNSPIPEPVQVPTPSSQQPISP